MKRPDTIHPVTCAVRYYTKTGNTKKLALAIAQALGVEALPISEPVSEAVDLLFLGNSYYAFSIDPEVRDFIRALDPKLVGKLVNFGSAAMLNSTWIPMEETEFHCRGEFKAFHKGRPNEEDLNAAAAFAKALAAAQGGNVE